MARAKKKAARGKPKGQVSAQKGKNGPSRGKSTDALPAQMRRYAELRAAGKGKAEAAIEAGYAAKSAGSRASRLEARPDVQAAITELSKAATERALDSDTGRAILARAANRVKDEKAAEKLGAEIRARLAEIAFADLRDIVKWDDEGNVTFTASDDLTEAQAALISGFTKTTKKIGGVETVEIKITTNSNLAALRELAKLAGIEPPKRNEHTGKDGEPIKTHNAGMSAETADKLRALLGIRGGDG